MPKGSLLGRITGSIGDDNASLRLVYSCRASTDHTGADPWNDL